MKVKLIIISIVLTLLVIPFMVSAQVDNFGKTDTIYADIAKIDNSNWSITISYTNDQNVLGLSIPLKMTAGLNRVVADSAVYTGGRVDNFAFKGFRPDTAIQCVTLGIIANIGPSNKTLYPGSGRLVTIFVSSLDKKPIEKLVVDTTTTSPNNSLLVVADTFQGENRQDTIPISERKEKIEIIPAFVVRQSK